MKGGYLVWEVSDVLWVILEVIYEDILVSLDML